MTEIRSWFKLLLGILVTVAVIAILLSRLLVPSSPVIPRDRVGGPGHSENNMVANGGPLAERSKAAEPKPNTPASKPQTAIVNRSFPADGIKKLILSAAHAEACIVTGEPKLATIEVSGKPSGGAEGYHSPDPNRRETPPAEFGLDFVSARHGDVLIVSTKEEMEYIHHHYSLKSLTLRLPAGIEVEKRHRKLTGDRAPDLAEDKR